MLIHGKNVEFIIEYGQTKLPQIRKIIKQLLLKNRALFSKKWLDLVRAKKLHNFVKTMLYCYLHNDLVKFLSYFDRMMEEKYIEVLNEHPEFIQSNELRIHLTFIVDESIQMMLGYVSELSEVEDVYFQVNLNYKMLVSILKYGEDSLKEQIFHEFFHHSDRERLVKSIYAGVRIYQLSQEDERNAPLNSYLIFKIFFELRFEGLNVFTERVIHNKPIYFFAGKFTELKSILENLTKQFNKNKFDSLVLMYKKSYLTYVCGAMMVSAIALSKLFEQGKHFSVWIKPSGLLNKFKGIEYNADQIKKFYGKKNFDLYFKYEEVRTIIDDTVNYLKKLSHIQFLREYEQACNSLGIEERFFTLDTYNYYKRKCWQNYQRLKAKHGFRR